MVDSTRVAQRKQVPPPRDPDHEPLPRVRQASRAATSWMERHPVARAAILSTPMVLLALVVDNLRPAAAGVVIGTALGFGYDHWRRRRSAA